MIVFTKYHSMMGIRKQVLVKATLFLVLTISLLSSAGCTRGPESGNAIDNEKERIETVIHNCFSWGITKDFNLFFNTIANDSNFISVTPYRRVKFGFSAVLKDTAFWASPYFKAIRHELRDLHIHISRSGGVAWFFCYLDDINEWKGQPANWKNTRWTGVLEKRNGKWIIVQQHFSFASE